MRWWFSPWDWKIGIVAMVLAWGRLAAAKGSRADAFTIVDGPVTEWQLTAHSATLLEDGRSVLLVQDDGSDVWRYPGKWLAGGKLNGVDLMRDHPAVRLLDGRVLVAGGSGVGCCGDKASRDAAVWDPKKRRWSRVARMLQPRYRHTMELLPDGRVMAIGGSTRLPDSMRVTDTVEAWDPATNKWSYLEPTNVGRYEHSSVVLSDGSIMVMGGWGDAVETYDPKTGKWEMKSPMASARSQPSAVVLPDGRVLVAGGTRTGYCKGKACEREVAEIWDPASGKWSEAGQMQKSRYWAQATLLKDGNVLVTGGKHHNGKEEEGELDIELWDHETTQWRIVGHFGLFRVGHTATLLPDGSVWVVGGTSNCTTEIIRPPGSTRKASKE